MPLLTTKQMAEQLACSTKTFAKVVRDRSIPYVAVGNSKRFDADEVIAHLKEHESPKTFTVVTKKQKTSSPVRLRSEFSGILG
jgi:excisionase family DNA binding protein